MNYMNEFVEKALIFRREAILILKYYLRMPERYTSPHRIIYMADDRMYSSGMFDRLKGMISLYALSKAQGKQFNIYHVNPFLLEDYLQPNSYNWICDDIQYCFFRNRPIINYPNDLNRLFKLRRESHVYIGHDIIDEINKHYNQNFEFGVLYRQLFKPTKHLQNKIDESIKQIGGEKFISIHIRLVNLLGDHTERLKEFSQLETTEAECLLEDLKKVILEIVSNNSDYKIVLATDSNIFCQYIKKEIPCIYCVPGKIKHVGNSAVVKDEEALKMFTDYYLLSMSERVFSIVGKGLYSSQFPLYAAKIGNKPFERVKI